MLCGPIMKDHDVISVKELSNPQSPVKTRNKLHCMKHKDKILEFYCETCQKTKLYALYGLESR